MMSLSHESLIVYQRTIEFVAWSSELIAEKQVKGVLLISINEHSYRSL